MRSVKLEEKRYHSRSYNSAMTAGLKVYAFVYNY